MVLPLGATGRAAAIVGRVPAPGSGRSAVTGPAPLAQNDEVSTDLTVARLGILAALHGGDSGLAFRLVLGLMDDGYGLPLIVTEVLVPIQREAGQLWETGDATISEEHVATAAIETLVAMLAGSFDQPVDAEVVVVACATGDHHALPARMASALLSYEGYRSIFLGPSVPAEDLAHYLPTVGADVLVVSCARPASLLGARACVAAGHAAGLPVVVGGGAFADGARWEQVGADAHAPTIDGLTELLSGLTPDPDAAERRAQAVAPAVDAIAAQRAALVVDLIDAVAAAGPAGVTALGSTAEELVDVLAVAVHFDDAALLAAEAARLASLLQVHGELAVTGDQLLAGLLAAVDTTGVDAGAVIVRAREVDAGAEPPA